MAKVGLLSLRVVPQQQCNGHCLCDCPARQLKQQLRSAHDLSDLFRAVSAVEPSLFLLTKTGYVISVHLLTLSMNSIMFSVVLLLLLLLLLNPEEYLSQFHCKNANVNRVQSFLL